MSTNGPSDCTNAVLSEKKGIFLLEMVMERYMYLHNTQKQLKITSYGRNNSFLDFHLVHNGVWLKLLGSLLEKLEILHLYVLR